MNKRRNAPGGAATPAEATETATGKTHNLHLNFTTPIACRQLGSIASLLLRGAENGLTITDLERVTGLCSRDIRKEIEQERRAGCPILADCKHGYFLPIDETEKIRFVRQMRNRAQEILQTAAAVEKSDGV